MKLEHICNHGDRCLIFIPGFLSAKDEFWALAEKLPKELACYQVDLFTDYPLNEKVTYAKFVAKFNACLENLPTKNKILAGYSLGARLAVAAYLDQPNDYRGLLLESFNPGMRTVLERNVRLAKDRELALQIVTKGLPSFLRTWYSNPIFGLSVVEIEDLVSEKSELDFEVIAKILEELSPAQMPSYWARLQEIVCPTLLLTGESDQRFTDIAKEANFLMPNAQHQIAQHAGHNVHEKNNKFYLNQLKEFLTTGLS